MVTKKKSAPPRALHLLSTTQLPMKSASAVAAIEGGWLVVDDDRGVFRVIDGEASLLRGPGDHSAFGDLEGLTVDGAGNVFVVAEESGVILRGALASRDTVVVGSIASPAKKKAKKKGGSNKGFEGLAWLPAALSPDDADALLVAHEAKPKRVLMVTPADLEVRNELELDDALDAALGDLADVAVDPVSGCWLLLSDESARIGVAKANGSELVHVGSIDLPFDSDEKPEGLAFVDDDTLAIVTDATARLRLFRVER
ncbi:MAG: SdiA-regulated domain-containing protein [Deltaproteobacteria bacterium]|nr:SdiA-regulated domain-containing protein [Deltaproteobacteria bacterium]